MPMISADAKAQKLLSLMGTLSQDNDRGRIITRFMKAFRDIWPEAHGHFTPDVCTEVPGCFPVESGDSHFGCLVVNDIHELSETDRALIRNALSLLGTIVKKQEQDTPPKKVERHHLKSFFEEIAENVQDGIWVTDEHDVIFYVNKGMEAIAGISKEHIVGNNVLEDFPKATTEQFNVFYRQAKHDLTPTWYEVTVRTPAGKDSWQNGWLVPVLKNGRFDGMICTIRDVTERKDAEKELEKSSLLLDAVYDAIISTDVNGNIVFWNTGAQMIYGYSREETLGQAISLIYKEENYPVLDEIMNHSIAGNAIHNKELTCIDKDRNERQILLSLTPLKDEHGQVKELVGVTKDITERKEAERELKQSEARYRQLVETASDAIYLMDERGIIIDTNRIASQMLQKSREEIIGSLIDTIDPNFPVDAFLAFWEPVPYEEQHIFETTHITKHGDLIPIEISGKKFRIDEETYYFGVARDISARKTSEKELKRQRDFFELVINSAPIRIFWKDLNCVYMGCNTAFVNDAGMESPEEVIGETDDILVWKEDAETYRADDRLVMRTGQAKLRYEEEFLNRDGERVVWRTSKMPLQNADGDIIGVVATSENITEEKLAAEKLQASEEKYRFLAEKTSDTIVLFDGAGRVEYTSPNVQGLSGYTPEEYMAFEPFENIYPDDRPIVEQNLQKIAKGADRTLVECRIFHKSGRLIWIQTRSKVIRDRNGNIESIISTLNDITRRKENEAQLTQLYTELKTIYDNDPSYIYLKDTHNNILKVSNAVAEATGLPKAQIEGKPSSEVYPHMAKTYYKDDREVIRTGEAKRNILETIPSMTGGMRWVMTSKIPIREHGEEVSGILVVAADVTALKESEEKYRLIVENLNDLLVKFDAQGVLKYVSPNYCDTFGVHEGDILGTLFIPLIHPDDVEKVKQSLATLHDPPHRTYHEERAKTVRGWRWFAWSVRAITDEQRNILEIVAVGRDISQQKAFEGELIKAKEQVEANEAKFRSYIDYAPDGIFIADERGKYLQVNPAACAITGYSYHELLTMSIPDLLLKEDIEQGMTHFQATKETGSAREEMRFVTKGGETRFWHVAAVKLSDTRFLGFTKDITERKKAEEELQTREEQYRFLAENTSDLIVQFDAAGRFQYISLSITALTGYTPEEYMAFETVENIHPDDRHIVRNNLKNIAAGAQESTSEYRIFHKDGHVIWIQSRTKVIRDTHGQIESLLTTSNDITERKHAEEALKKSEIRFRALFEQSGGYCMILDPNTESGIPVIVDANQAALQNHGYTREEFIGRPVADIDDEDGKQMVIARTGMIMTGEPFYVENTHLRKDGSTFPVAVNAKRIDIEGESPLIFTIEYDISKRKEAERKLQEREEQYRMLAENARHLILTHNFDGKITYANSYALQFLHVSQEQIVGLEIQHFLSGEEEQKRFQQRIQEFQAGKTTAYQFELEIALPGGEHRIVEVFGNPMTREHTHLSVLVIAYDITERKKAALQLQESEEKLRFAIDFSPLGVCMNDMQGNFLSTNRAYETMLGYSKEELKQLSFFDITHPGDRPENRDLFEKMISEKTAGFTMEKRYIRQDGNVIDVRVHAGAIHDAQGKPAFGLAFVEDITERKQFVKTLQDRNAYIEAIMDNMPIGFALNTVDDGDVKYMNSLFEEIYGWPREILTNTAIFFEKVFPDPEFREEMRTKILADTQSGDPERMRWDDLKIVTSHGEERYIYAFNIPLLDQNLMISTVQDVTARKYAESALRESEHRFRILYENSPDMYVSVSPRDARILLCNDTLLHNTGYSKDEVIDQPVFTLYHEDCLDEAHHTFQQFVETGKIRNRQLILKRKNGSKIDVTLNVDCVRDENGDILYSMSSWRDNTELKQAQEQILDSLREKETLLRELYHRTKNNMNVIQSMLTLQAAFSRNAEVERIAKEVGDKIQAMALVHQKLYQSQNLSRIPLHDYLPELAELLRQSYSISPAKITLDLEVAPVFALIDTAIPCGLILNELISNAFKHAFPGERNGNIQIQLTEDEQGLITLQVSDNGVGVPQGFDFHAQGTLGLQSIVMIAEHQLQGTLIFTADGGVTCRIQFTDTSYHARV